MKKQNCILACFAIILIIFSTGCGKDNYLKDDSGNIIVNEETGQSVQKNILCQPSNDSHLYQIYLENESQLSIKLSDLPTCENFSLSTNAYQGLWEALLVRPLALLILKVGYFVHNFGIAVMAIGLLIRIILLPLSIKSMRASTAMQKAQPEIQKIEKKWSGKTDNESMMAKSQETMMIYQKYKINPVSGCITSILQIPLFFAFLAAINEVPAIFEGSLFGMNLGMTPWKGLQQGEYIYIILIFLIIGTTYISFKNSMKVTQSNDMMKQMNYMFMFMIISISVASFSLPTAIAFYWIITNGFAVIQNYIVKKVLDNDEKKSIYEIQENTKKKKEVNKHGRSN